MNIGKILLYNGGMEVSTHINVSPEALITLMLKLIITIAIITYMLYTININGEVLINV